MGKRAAKSKAGSGLSKLKSLFMGKPKRKTKDRVKTKSKAKAASKSKPKAKASSKAKVKASHKKSKATSKKTAAKATAKKPSSAKVTAKKAAPGPKALAKDTPKSAAAVAPKVAERLAKAQIERLDTTGRSVCREVACDRFSTTGGYCRPHYIKNWKKIKRKELILKEKKLNRYIEELAAKYPDKYIEAIRNDLASDKEFSKVVSDLELADQEDDYEGESSDSIENIIDNIRRDVEDEDF